MTLRSRRRAQMQRQLVVWLLPLRETTDHSDTVVERPAEVKRLVVRSGNGDPDRREIMHHDAMRVLPLTSLGLFTTLALGCGSSHTGDAGPDAWRPPVVDAGRDTSTTPPPPATGDIDLLVVMDNSGSMTEERWSFVAEFPRLMQILATGDLDLDGSTSGPEDFTPVSSLHFGIISTDMGTGGYTVPTCARPDFGDDGILRTQGRTDLTGCMATYPSFLHFAAPQSPDEFADLMACVTHGVGSSGCGFEQQLEATLKAVSPAAPTPYTADRYLPPSFFRNTLGHADTNNAGFLRDDSLLVVVVVTDEEDCSARDPELYDPSSPTYGATDLNLRCFAHQDVALHPISRYVDGLLAVRRHPSRLLFAIIAGVPVDLVSAPSAPVDWDPLVSEDPAVRDSRMAERVDPAMPSRLIPSCNVPGRGVAFPPVRLLRVAQRLESFGAHVSVGSICQESFRSVLTDIIRQLPD